MCSFSNYQIYIGKGYVTREDIERYYNYDSDNTPLSPINTNKLTSTASRRFTPGDISSNTIDYASLYIMDNFDTLLSNLQISGGVNARGSAELFDFVEYYWNIFATMDNSEILFEKLIRRQWNFEL